MKSGRLDYDVHYTCVLAARCVFCRFGCLQQLNRFHAVLRTEIKLDIDGSLLAERLGGPFHILPVVE